MWLLGILIKPLTVFLLSMTVAKETFRTPQIKVLNVTGMGMVTLEGNRRFNKVNPLMKCHHYDFNRTTRSSFPSHNCMEVDYRDHKQVRRRLSSSEVTEINSNEIEKFKELFIHILKAARDKVIVLLHDNQITAVDLVNVLLQIYRRPIILIDIASVADGDMTWLRVLQTGFYMHIYFLYNDLSLDIIDYAMISQDYAPSYLLLIDTTSNIPAQFLLNREGMNKITSLGFIQFVRNSGTQPQTYQLHSYNTFQKNVSFTYSRNYGIEARLKLEDLFPDRFDNFHEYRFHLASWGMDFPYIYKKEGKPDAKGFCVRMLTEISERLNFTFKVYDLPPDEQWGSLVNGSWKGMIGEVYRGEKDFGINQMDIIESRYEAVDFSFPFWTGNSRFLIRNPQPPPRWSSIVFPFNWKTWAGVVFTIMALMMTYLVFFKILNLWRFGDSGWVVLEVVRTILGIDCQSFTTNISIILLLGSWRLAAMVIAISYKGNLVAYISVPPSPVRLRTLDQLASSGLIPMMTDYGSYLPVVLKQSSDPTLRTLGERLEIIPFDNELAFQMVGEGSYAFLEESSFLYSLVVSHQVSNVYYLAESLNQVYLGWYFPKNTPWKYKFDHYTSAFAEFGLIDYWFEEERKMFEKEMNYTNMQTQDDNTLRPLGMEDVQGAFVVYGMGIGASTLAAIQEIFWYKTSSFIQGSLVTLLLALRGFALHTEWWIIRIPTTLSP